MTFHTNNDEVIVAVFFQKVKGQLHCDFMFCRNYFLVSGTEGRFEAGWSDAVQIL